MFATEIIKKYFKYLTDEYGFFVEHERDEPEAMGNAYVDYKSDLTAIRIVVDRSQVLINIGKAIWPAGEWFEFSDVVSYFNPSTKEVYDFSHDSLDYQTYIEIQAERLSRMLRQWCEPLLNGDFSMQDQIKAVEKKRVVEMLEHFQKLQNYKRTKH